MGSCSLAKLLRLACLAAIASAAAFLAAIALAAPAAADNHIDGGGNDTTVKPWDTDNLRYRGYSARNFRIPFHEYAGYAAFTDNTTFQSGAREACQSAIADGFFQTGGSVGAKNDFPVLSKTGGSWGDSATGLRGSGCGDFVTNQHLVPFRCSLQDRFQRADTQKMRQNSEKCPNRTLFRHFGCAAEATKQQSANRYRQQEALAHLSG